MKKEEKKQKILVAMSGGVDSSVAAALLVSQGYQVTGVFMINWREDGMDGECGWEKDYLDARRVAAQLGIELFTWDFSQQYKKYVFDYFIKAYQNGLTPNPDTLCNKQIKFGLFLERAQQLGFDKIATGHYARIKKSAAGFKLITGRDKNKDQSYFLYELDQQKLSQAGFPVGNLVKKKVREMARRFGLPVDEKRDSYGICYIGEKNMREFLGQYIQKNPGEIINKQGRVLGKHSGLYFYTLGQRQGIGIGGVGPFYVVRKDFEKNQLVVTSDADDPELFNKEIYLQQVNWLVGQKPNLPLRCLVRYRHLQPLQQALVSEDRDGQLKVNFKKPQKAVAPGQAAVLYRRLGLASRDFEVLGGGVIKLKTKN